MVPDVVRVQSEWIRAWQRYLHPRSIPTLPVVSGIYRVLTCTAITELTSATVKLLHGTFPRHRPLYDATFHPASIRARLRNPVPDE